jgi:O-antigen/teichoic acid export membrane protein
MSYFTKSASIILVTPLIITKFSEVEIVMWYLFATIISMTGLADIGFRSTFVRFIAYANGGAIELGKKNIIQKNAEKSDTNWNLLGKIYSHMLRIYLPLSFLICIGLLIGGYYSLKSTIAQVDDPYYYWLAWILLAITTSMDFYGKVYYNYLEGLNEIALVKRVETFFRLLVILLLFLVLTFSPSIFNLSLVLCLGYVLNLIRNALLAHKIRGGKLKTLSRHKIEKAFLVEIWKPAWRTGISGFLAIGLTNFVSILFVQLSTTAAAASYLFTMRILTEIRNVANAPFYSKIPLFARLTAEGNYTNLVHQAKIGMKRSHIMYVLGVIVTGCSINYVLDLIGSKIDFIDPLMWILFSFAFYVHRYSALHIQLYMTSNHIISHIADSVSGLIFALTSYFLMDFIGLYSIPVGMIMGYLGFYSWYSARYSLRFIKMTFFQFEKDTSLPFALILLVFYFIYYFLLN